MVFLKYYFRTKIHVKLSIMQRVVNSTMCPGSHTCTVNSEIFVRTLFFAKLRICEVS